MQTLEVRVIISHTVLDKIGFLSYEKIAILWGETAKP